MRSLSNKEKAAIVLNFVFPCNTSHVTDLHFRFTLIPEMRACALSARSLPRYFGGKFIFLLLSVWQSISVTKPLVFGVSSEYNKEANWVDFLLHFSGEDTTPCPCLLKGWRTGLRTPILGKFLSVFFYLARLSSVWCVKCNVRVWGSKYFFLILIFSWTQPWIQGTWIPVEHLHLWMACCWLARSQEHAPTRSLSQVPGWTLHLTLM